MGSNRKTLRDFALQFPTGFWDQTSPQPAVAGGLPVTRSEICSFTVPDSASRRNYCYKDRELQTIAKET